MHSSRPLPSQLPLYRLTQGHPSTSLLEALKTGAMTPLQLLVTVLVSAVSRHFSFILARLVFCAGKS